MLNHMYMSDVTRDKVNQSPEYKLNPATLMSFGADHNLHQPPISYDLYFSSVMIFCVFSGEVVSQTFAIDGRQHIEKQDMQAAYQLSYLAVKPLPQGPLARYKCKSVALRIEMRKASMNNP